MDDWYIISDIEQFTNTTRAIVYNNFGNWASSTQKISSSDFTISEKDKEELESLLSYQESFAIISSQVIKKQKKTKIKYMLNDNIFLNIIKDLNSRIVSNIINNLVQKGVVESAFDDQANDFIFWIKDDDKDKSPKTD